MGGLGRITKNNISNGKGHPYDLETLFEFDVISAKNPFKLFKIFIQQDLLELYCLNQ